MMFKEVEGGGVGEGNETNAKINYVIVCHPFLNAIFTTYNIHSCYVFESKIWTMRVSCNLRVTFLPKGVFLAVSKRNFEKLHKF